MMWPTVYLAAEDMPGLAIGRKLVEEQTALTNSWSIQRAVERAPSLVRARRRLAELAGSVVAQHLPS